MIGTQMVKLINRWSSYFCFNTRVPCLTGSKACTGDRCRCRRQCYRRWTDVKWTTDDGPGRRSFADSCPRPPGIAVRRGRTSPCVWRLLVGRRRRRHRLRRPHRRRRRRRLRRIPCRRHHRRRRWRLRTKNRKCCSTAVTRNSGTRRSGFWCTCRCTRTHCRPVTTIPGHHRRGSLSTRLWPWADWTRTHARWSRRLQVGLLPGRPGKAK